jgi:hypothetical protein
MPSLRSTVLPCCANVGSGLLLIPVFYGLAWYDKHVFSGIGLALRRHHWWEYLNATLESCWKGVVQKWFLVDTHTAPQWTKKHLLPLDVNDK